MYINELWTSTIRYHKGVFYVGFCTSHGKFSMCTATKPSGPWTRKIFSKYLYDPGLLFDDDGKVYVLHAKG